MKTFIVTIGFLICALVAFCQEGVNFEDISLKEAIAKAKKQGKLVFVDCYTSWCVPCKEMTTIEFPKKEAGDYFNKRFVCLKSDMEEGEGIEISKQFSVHNYPTFLVINTDGSLRQLIIGGDGIDALISNVEAHLSEDLNLGTLKNKFDNGERDKAFLSKYINLLFRIENYSLAMDVTDALFQQLNEEERVSKLYWFVYNDILSPRNTEANKYLIRNWEKFIPTVGKESVGTLFSTMYVTKLFDILSGRDKKTTLEELDNIALDVAGLEFPNKGTIQSYITIAKALRKGDIDYLIQTCEEEFLKFQQHDFPAFLFKNIKEKVTPAQQARWDNLLEKVENK